MKKYYITFGPIHSHNINDKIFDKDTVACIEAPSYASARATTFAVFSDKWSFFYQELTADLLTYFPQGVLQVTFYPPLIEELIIREHISPKEAFKKVTEVNKIIADYRTSNNKLIEYIL